MTNIPTDAAWRPYLRALAGTGLDVASVGAWVAAAELSPARRRLARATLVLALVAVPDRGSSADPAASVAPVPGGSSGLPFVDAGITLPAGRPSRADVPPRRAVLVGAAVLTAAVTFAAGGAVVGHRLQRRWLARLSRHGHPHPHRALAVRTAAVYAVLVAPARLLAARPGAAAGRRRSVRAGTHRSGPPVR